MIGNVTGHAVVEADETADDGEELSDEIARDSGISTEAA